MTLIILIVSRLGFIIIKIIPQSKFSSQWPIIITKSYLPLVLRHLSFNHLGRKICYKSICHRFVRFFVYGWIYFYRYYATTQFQPYHARQAFPCFDEPQFKSIFVISITRASSLSQSYSNMPIAGTVV